MSCGHSHALPLPPAGDGSSTARIADQLAVAIQLGQLAPGEPLREIELAETHRVSRTIIRAALQRLEAQGLAEITLNKGARVRTIAAQAFDDMIELHVLLTGMAARHASERATPEQVERIRQFADLMAHVAEDGGPPEEFQHLRIGFARALYAAAGDVLAERLRIAAPVTPHHGRAMLDITAREGQMEAARLACDVLHAIESHAPQAAAAAAERMIRGHAARVKAIQPVREVA